MNLKQIEVNNHANKRLPRTVSLTIPTEIRAAFPLTIKSCIVSGFSEEHPGGTTGRDS